MMMMPDSSCLFCKIIRREALANIVYEDESCIAFRDIKPQAPVHILVIPRKHYASAAEADTEDEVVLGHLHRVAAELAQQYGLAQGHRVVMNTGAASGQSIFHVHLHLLGGRSFRWPPGYRASPAGSVLALSWRRARPLGVWGSYTRGAMHFIKKAPESSFFARAFTVLTLWIAMGGHLAAALSPAEARRALDQGIDHFYNLEYDEAIANFLELRADDPRNPSWQNHLALGYFYKELYLAGALEGDLFDASNRFLRTRRLQTDPALEDSFRQANQSAIRMCELRLKEDARDQEALYACGVAYAARATHQGLVERSAFEFLGSARRANDYHARLVRLAPRYYDGYLVPGIYDFVLGSLPKPVKVLFFFAGLTGDKQRGLRLVESTAQWGDGARSDAQILLTVMYRRERRFADARRTLETLAAAFPRNYIFPLEIASIHRAAGEIEEAIRGYEQVLERVRAGLPNYPQAPVARIHFELGELYRRTGDLATARQHLDQVAGSRGSTPELERESALLRSQLDIAAK